MKLELILALAVVATSSLFLPAANADSYSSVTTTEVAQPVIEKRETTVQEAIPSTTVIREQPVIINKPADVVVVKEHRHHHHLIDVGPVKAF